jgi:hypothetical protein
MTRSTPEERETQRLNSHPCKTGFSFVALVTALLILPATASDVPNQLPDPDGRPVDMTKPVQVFQDVKHEWLTVSGRHIGPELQFGHIMGHIHDEPVLILKACIGNRSLGWDLLPPGSERFEFEGRIDAGYKDQNPAQASRYEQNLAHFIKTLRKDFDAPDAKFVLATIAFGGDKLSGPGPTIAKAQLAVDGDTGKCPEFKGKVAAVDARPFWREKGVSPSGAGYHYNHNAETYMGVGNALGRAMAELLEGNRSETAVAFSAGGNCEFFQAIGGISLVGFEKGTFYFFLRTSWLRPRGTVQKVECPLFLQHERGRRARGAADDALRGSPSWMVQRAVALVKYPVFHPFSFVTDGGGRAFRWSSWKCLGVLMTRAGLAGGISSASCGSF